MKAIRTLLATVAIAGLVWGGPTEAEASTFPIFDGDPTDASGQPHPILPGIPLILPQPDGKYRPPVVDTLVQGDVDIVVRAGTPTVGATMPAPVALPPTATAGGEHVASGSTVPFTVIASDGSATNPPGGLPLVGPELDGIPVLVLAYADLDGDGTVGPTNEDPSGAGDNGREAQESNFPVGRQVAIFQNGVAQGTLAVSLGGPASEGGVAVVLTAVAYIGPFSPDFFVGSLPEGPPVATLMPFFPRTDPDRVVDSDGNGGPALPAVRIGVGLESAFDPPVDDPELGTPFALPVDGSSPTIDRAFVGSGNVSRVTYVRPSLPADFTGDEAQVALYPGNGGQLFERIDRVDLSNAGAGSATVRLVPVDLLDNITDPSPGTSATLVAGAGVVVTAPDSDGDPSREVVTIGDAAGAAITLAASGQEGSPTTSTLTVEFEGFPVSVLAIDLNGSPPLSIPTLSSGTTLLLAMLLCSALVSLSRRRARA